MFLSVLSGTVVALAMLAQVDRLRETFTVAAILMLSVVLFVEITRITSMHRC